MPSSLEAISIHMAVCVLPVVAFLAGLWFLDSYRLVRPAAVLGSLAVGALAAGAALLLAWVVLSLTGWTQRQYGVLAGPFIEETLKAAYVVYLIVSRRIGFAVDAAIHGFAVGAGFAVVENLYRLAATDPTPALLVARGFGTALMHGGATAVLGIAAKRVSEQRGAGGWLGLAAGFVVALAAHVLYNRATAHPVAAAVTVAVALPALMIAWFRESEESLRRWLGIGFDTDAELLEMMGSGRMADTRIGAYMASLRDRFPPQVVADMFCMLRLRVELSLRAKGLLLMRRAGFEPPADPEVAERFSELKYLERSVGRTGMLAMLPLLSWRERDLWELHRLHAEL